jgi:serpin B
LSGTPGNIVFSPYSIGTAMAMVLEGARGETEREMRAALKLQGGLGAIAEANANVLAILNAYDKSKVQSSCPEGMRPAGAHCEMQRLPDIRCPPRTHPAGALCIAEPEHPPSATVAVANALMLIRKDVPVLSDYTALLKDRFAAELFRDADLAQINGWVASKTEGKIERILDELDPQAAAVLLNAIYFKAAWASAFSKQDTRDEPFSLSPSQHVPVPMMQKRATVALVARAGYRAVRLPYVVGTIGMIIVLPDAVDGLAAVAARQDAAEISTLLAALRSGAPNKAIRLALPRFKVSFNADLVPPFRSAGMVRAFEPRRADFSGMVGPTAHGRFAIGQIVHRAVIEVQEEGTEAAAATAVVMVLTSAPPPIQDNFRVDRPFLFYLVDDATGAILFQGRVVDPR